MEIWAVNASVPIRSRAVLIGSLFACTSHMFHAYASACAWTDLKCEGNHGLLAPAGLYRTNEVDGWKD
eukprot:1139183-Pelagomonas_calceolata.AAC.3